MLARLRGAKGITVTGQPPYGRIQWVDGLLAAASALFGIGLFAPLFTVEKLLIFSDTVSIASSLYELGREGYVFLFLLILVFSVLLPLTKLSVLIHVRWLRPQRPALRLRWVERLAKWSMLDVFVVALLVVSVKLRFVSQIEIRYGLYAFAASVLLTMMVTARLTRPVPGRRVVADP